MNFVNLMIGAWCFVGATILGYLLYRLQKAQRARGFDAHTYAAIALLNADTRCPICGSVGPVREHIHYQDAS